jgi:hypothetical protein
MDLGEIGWDGVDWIALAQDRDKWRVLVNSILNLRVPWNAGKLLSGCTTGDLSSSAQLHTVRGQIWFFVSVGAWHSSPLKNVKAGFWGPVSSLVFTDNSFPELKRHEKAADHSSLCSAENTWSYISVPHTPSWRRASLTMHRDNLTLKLPVILLASVLN